MDPLQQIGELADAAQVHAAEVHGVQIGTQNLEFVDRVLDRERDTGVGEDRQSLALCYGCWLGSYAVQQHAAVWLGLQEPVAPRLNVGGVVCSPIEAVGRRLASPDFPSLQQLAAQLAEWSQWSADPSGREDQNRVAWDQRVDDPRFTCADGLPPDRQAALAALDPWLAAEGISGRRILCLGAGGATHGPLFAMAGARVTVVDFSPAQLQWDRQVAEQHRLSLTTVLTSIEDLTPLENGSFEVVVQPVSACYVRDLPSVYAEVARVLVPGGLYTVQHKQPISLQSGSLLAADAYPILHPAVEGWHLAPADDASLLHREVDTHEFVHTLETLLGGLCRSGFVIEDFQEPPRGDAWAPRGSAEHRACFVPPYLKIKARRRSG